MQPHQERVVAERDELADKWNRLRVFISGSVFTSLLADEQARLRRQERIMEEYVTVLNERIASFR